MTAARVFGFVFARGGSKGLPRKNLRRIGGKCLVALAVEHLRAVERVELVFVSTDATEIAAAAQESGAIVPFLRPAVLATDRAAEYDAWRHAVDHVSRSHGDFDVIVSAPATAPLRLPGDVARCLEALDDDAFDAAMTVAPMARHPYFNTVTIDPAGRATRLGGTSAAFVRRQDAPAVSEIVPACFAATTRFVRSGTPFYDGRVAAVEIPRERAVDIDTAEDLAYARWLWARRKREAARAR